MENSLVAALVTGAKPFTELTPIAFTPCGPPVDARGIGSPNWSTLLPQLDFPTFDGSNPKIWKKCENFFEIYGVPSVMWVKLATMNFNGSAAFWLHTMYAILVNSSWSELCLAVCNWFEREHHSQLIRQFFHMKQYGSVTEYVEQFDSLVHQLLAHDSSMQQIVITNRFVDGLKEDIRSAVLMQRPLDLDTACSLAILQEEILGGSSRKEIRRSDTLSGRNSGRNSHYSGFPSIPAAVNYSGSAMKNSPGDGGHPSDDKRQLDPTKEVTSQPAGTKFAALMAYRKAKGLCYKCGSRWQPGHKCATNVPLHVVEELWQLVQDSTVQSTLPAQTTDSDSTEDLRVVSLAAVNGQEAFKTIRFWSTVNKKEAVVLADSGSSRNFISELMASSMPSGQELSLPIKVRVANGTVLTCTHEIQKCPIWINGHCFTVDLKILPLKCYDIILGIDWLEEFSPMEVHWKDKWMSFVHTGAKITLQGIVPDLTDCTSIAAGQLEQLLRKDELWCILQLYAVHSNDNEGTSAWPEDINQLISQFSDLFAEPKELPPKWPYDHSIPLIAGA
ncbi:uncharacterized protein C2845_PM17G07550 [Panicum miliaceum]|uniref:Retrotransposon gag domain-containing protein n=1 Tax=Panicum miliaceum TaxID=4540 RepID=A0A3L6Q3U8_PANMI|nr:uncharacterized protein C2845_PM17G07550 [Panicum miliaceum]